MHKFHHHAISWVQKRNKTSNQILWRLCLAFWKALCCFWIVNGNGNFGKKLLRREIVFLTNSETNLLVKNPDQMLPLGPLLCRKISQSKITGVFVCRWIWSHYLLWQDKSSEIFAQYRNKDLNPIIGWKIQSSCIKVKPCLQAMLLQWLTFKHDCNLQQIIIKL